MILMAELKKIQRKHCGNLRQPRQPLLFGGDNDTDFVGAVCSSCVAVKFRLRAVKHVHVNIFFFSSITV
jgi:hypothetical protein